MVARDRGVGGGGVEEMVNCVFLFLFFVLNKLNEKLFRKRKTPYFMECVTALNCAICREDM